MSGERTRSVQRGGFTILEVLISTTVFMLVSGAVVTTLVVSNALNSTNRETMLASQAAQSAIEALKGATFAEVFARYNVSKLDDPAAGTSPGAGFAVRGLDVQAGDVDGLVGGIEFPGDGKELREDEVDAELGLPRDLNGDGAIDAGDHAAAYRILPVRIVVAWRGRTGDQRLELLTVLTEL